MKPRTRLAIFIIVVAALMFGVTRCAMAAPTTKNEWIEKARAEIQKVQVGADFAWGQMNAAYSQLGTVQIELGKREQEVKDLILQSERAQAELDKVKPKYHKLKTVACLIALAAGVFGALNLPIPLQFKIYAVGIAAVASPLLVWFLL